MFGTEVMNIFVHVYPEERGLRGLYKDFELVKPS